MKRPTGRPSLHDRPTMAEGTGPEPTRILYYSHPKVGKTRAAATATKVSDHVLWIEAEPGIKRAAFDQWGDIDQSKIIRIAPPELTFNGLQSIVGEVEDLVEEGESWSIVVDTITALQTVLLTQTVDQAVKVDALKDNKRKNEPTKPFLEDYGTNTEELRRLCRQIVTIDCHTIITAHVREAVDPVTKQPIGEIIPATTEKFGETLFGLVDVVMYLDVVKGTRVGYIVPTSDRRSGDRIGLMPVVMPEPFFDRVHAYMAGELTAKADPIYREFRKSNKALIDKEVRRSGRPELPEIGPLIHQSKPTQPTKEEE